MLTEVPENIKAMLYQHGGTYMGIVNELDKLMKKKEIYSYSVYEGAIFIYNKKCDNISCICHERTSIPVRQICSRSRKD